MAKVPVPNAKERVPMVNERKQPSSPAMNRAMDKGGPHKTVGVNKSIRRGAGIGPSGKPR